MVDNIERFGKLVDDGDSGDGKASFISSDCNPNVSIEIDTDDVNSEEALEFKAELMWIWNKQQESVDRTEAELEKLMVEVAFILVEAIKNSEDIDSRFTATKTYLDYVQATSIAANI